MADPREVDEAIDYMIDLYGRQAPSSRLREAWYAEFDESDGRTLLAVIKTACRTEKFMPSLAVIRGLMADKEGAKTGTNEPPPCQDCFKLPGWREMAIQWYTPDGTKQARCLLAACECRLGQVRQAGGQRTWREVWESWRGIRDRLVADGGALVQGFPVKTHRDLPLLEAWHRDTNEILIRHPQRPRSVAVAEIVKDLRARDPHAAHRRRTIANDEIREEGEEYP